MAFIDLLQAHGWDLPIIHGVHEGILATASNGAAKTLKCAAVVPLGGWGLATLAAGPSLSAAEITSGLATLGGITLLPALRFMNPMTAGLVAVAVLGSVLGFVALQLASWACH